MVVAAVGGGGSWWAVALLTTVFTCFQMLPNESKVYHFDLILNALPVHMPIQVPKNGHSAAEVLTFWVPFPTPKTMLFQTSEPIPKWISK